MKKLLVALVVGALLALPLSAMAMEKINSTDLEGVTGQAGVSIGFGNTVNTTISFSSLSIGDPDGVAVYAPTEGWMIIQAGSGEALGLDLQIYRGGVLSVDIAYSGGTAGGTIDVSGVSIPTAHSFLALSLPQMGININMPSTLAIGFGTQSGTLGCTMALVSMGGLQVTMDPISNLFLWCHD